jgi:hypothetical protein
MSEPVGLLKNPPSRKRGLSKRSVASTTDREATSEEKEEERRGENAPPVHHQPARVFAFSKHVTRTYQNWQLEGL